MESIFWAIILIVFIIAAGFFIYVLLEVKAALRALKEFLKITGGSVAPTMDELQRTLSSVRNSTENLDSLAVEAQKTLRSMRDVTDNAAAVTRDITVLSGSVREVGENVKHISGLLGDVTFSAVAKATGVRAGIRAAGEVLAKSLFTGKFK